MTQSDDRDSLSVHHRRLREMYVKDHQVDREPLADDLRDSVPDLAAALASDPEPLVYTAFDGDLFGLTPQMRTYALRRGALPANPESIVGYHDSVRHHGPRKDLVLLDDLAILNKCDQLWIFTDVGPTAAEAARSLAEGVLVELLFFLKHQEALGKRAIVEFIPTANLFDQTKDPVPYRCGYAQTEAALGSDQDGIRVVLESAERLPPVAYLAHDPLDAKHVHWLRPYAYGYGVVLIVPTLAIERSDLELVHGEDVLARTTSARARLVRLADELWIIPPIQRREESYTVRILRAMRRDRRLHELDDKVWSRIEIPKATSADWHITRKEAAVQHA